MFGGLCGMPLPLPADYTSPRNVGLPLSAEWCLRRTNTGALCPYAHAHARALSGMAPRAPRACVRAYSRMLAVPQNLFTYTYTCIHTTYIHKQSTDDALSEGGDPDLLCALCPVPQTNNDNGRRRGKRNRSL